MNIISTIIIVLILLGLIYQLIAFFILKNELQKNSNISVSRRKNYPFITILKPIKGIDDQLKENLKSFFELDYPQYEIIFGVQSFEDPAIEIINSVKNSHPEIQARLIVSSNKIGLNPKINNLYNMYPYVKGEIVLISDSNTRVKPDFLKLMANELIEPNVGLVTATIRGEGAKNSSSLMENIHLGSFLAPNVFAVGKLSDIKIVVGKALLIPKTVLEKIGGLQIFKNYLAEDYFMGVKIQEYGYKVKNSTVFVDNINEKWGFDKFLNRHSRWAKIRYQINKNTYLLEIISNPIFNSFILAALLHNYVGLVQFIATILIKSFVDYLSLKTIDAKIKFHQLFFVPVKDLILGIIWFVPFINSSVNWRNNYFKIYRNTLLRPILSET